MTTSSGTRSPLVLGVTVLLIMTFIALAVSELVVRKLDRVPTAIYEPDSVVLYRLAPDSRKIGATGGRQFNVDIDSLGYRGSDFNVHSPVRRIAVFGDSFIAGEFSPLAETFVEQLRVNTAARLHDSVEAVNVGVAGYGPDQTLLRMRADLERLKPDLVMVSLFPFNDFGDLLRNKLLAVDSAGALMPRGGRLTDSMRTEFQRTAHPTGWRRLHLVRLAERAIELRRARSRARVKYPEFTQKAMQAMDSTLVAYDNWADSLVGYEVFRDEWDADIAITPEARAAVRKMALMSAVLRAIHAETERAHVPLLLMIIPAAEDICPGYQRHADTVAFPTYARSRITDSAERIARDAGILTFNLWQPFQSNTPCSLYFERGDLHWNAAGQALAAKLVADTIAAHALMPTKARAR